MSLRNTNSSSLLRCELFVETFLFTSNRTNAALIISRGSLVMPMIPWVVSSNYYSEHPMLFRKSTPAVDTVSNRSSSMELVCPLSATQPITLNFLYGDCISDAFTSIPGGKAGCVGVTENLFHSICGNPFLPYTAETPQMPFQQSILFYDSPVPS